MMLSAPEQGQFVTKLTFCDNRHSVTFLYHSLFRTKTESADVKTKLRLLLLVITARASLAGTVALIDFAKIN